MQTPSSDAKWILGAIGTAMLVTIGALSLQLDRESDAIRAEVAAQLGAVRAEVDGLRAEMNARFDGVRAEIGALRDVVGEMRTDLRGFDARLRAVEIETAKVVQRLAILERIILPSPAPEPEPDAEE